MKMVRDLTEQVISDMHARSVLILSVASAILNHMLLQVSNGRSRNRGCICEGGVSNLLFGLPCGSACIRVMHMEH